MTDELPDKARDDLSQFLFALADDEFIMANRYSRWVGSGPTLEEDNNLSSFVQDELGHARLWLEVLADADPDGRSVTELAQNRPAAERRHTLLVEPDHDGFADTVVRNFLYDYAEKQFIEAMRDADDEEIASRAEVVIKEEHFHREHADQWLEILSATEEGREKLRAALDENLQRARDCFAFEEGLGERLRESGVLSAGFDDLEAAWIDDVVAIIEAAPFEYDTGVVREMLNQPPETNGRAGEHTEILDEIVANLFPTKDEMYPDHTDLDGDIRYDEKIGLK